MNVNMPSDCQCFSWLNAYAEVTAPQVQSPLCPQFAVPTPAPNLAQHLFLPCSLPSFFSTTEICSPGVLSPNFQFLLGSSVDHSQTASSRSFLINVEEIFKTRLWDANKKQFYTEMCLWRQRNQEVLALGISGAEEECSCVDRTNGNEDEMCSTVEMCSRVSNCRTGTATTGHTRTLGILHALIQFHTRHFKSR